MPILPTLRATTPPHPRICEYGPCVHYHRFTTQVDAQQPATGGSAVHFETHHYCYPTAGVETVLADMPVTECNRWEPTLQGRWEPALQWLRDGLVADFAAMVDKWKEQRQAELDAEAYEAEMAKSEIDAALAATPTDVEPHQ
jgi:hypothetical protein